MNKLTMFAALLLISLPFVGCDDSPPPPPPPPSDAGTDAGPDADVTDAGFDGGTPDDGGLDAGPFDAGPFDAGPFDAAVPTDAGPPPATGPFADIVVTGARVTSHRLVPPANQVVCNVVGGDNVFIGMAPASDGSGQALQIDAAGPLVVGPYTPRTGRERPETFTMLYRHSMFESYGIATTSTPCTFDVTTLSGGVLDATFDCRGLVSLTAPGAAGVDVSGRVRCDFP